MPIQELTFTLDELQEAVIAKYRNLLKEGSKYRLTVQGVTNYTQYPFGQSVEYKVTLREEK